MRHGKSDWDANYSGDHRRPLADRGVRSARLMGRLITALGLAPDRVISSTALRASATATLAASTGGWTSPVEHEDGFYGSGPDEVLRLAARSHGERLMLVGHEPTWSKILQRLTGASSEMKTAALAVIDLHLDDWSLLPDSRGTLSLLIQPRWFFGSEWDPE